MIQITGITRIQQRLNKIQRARDDTYIHKILNTLSKHGYNEVQVTYGSATFDNKTPDVDVSIYWEDDHKVAIQVSGVDALFLEFGTGVKHNTPRDYPQIDFDPRFLIGGYGKGHGKQGFWFYPRIKNPVGTPKFYKTKNGYVDSKKWNITSGTPSAKGLYYGMKTMKDEVIELIRSVIV